MKIELHTLSKPLGYSWQVCLDQHSVSFRSEAEARAFVATLEARLRAPHVLPREPRQQRIAS